MREEVVFCNVWRIPGMQIYLEGGICPWNEIILVLPGLSSLRYICGMPSRYVRWLLRQITPHHRVIRTRTYSAMKIPSELELYGIRGRICVNTRNLYVCQLEVNFPPFGKNTTVSVSTIRVAACVSFRCACSISYRYAGSGVPSCARIRRSSDAGLRRSIHLELKSTSASLFSAKMSREVTYAHSNDCSISL